MDTIQVFLSSKQSEFQIDRALLADRIKEYSMLEAVNAEDWPPESEPVRALMLEKVNSSMIYVGLFGSIYSEATELEYKAACANPYRERLIYLKNMPDDQRAPELLRFIGDLNAQNTVAHFDDVRDLVERFNADLCNALIQIALTLRRLGSATQGLSMHTRFRVMWNSALIARI